MPDWPALAVLALIATAVCALAVELWVGPTRAETTVTTHCAAKLPRWLDPADLAEIDPADRGWKNRRNCAGTDPDIFFPPAGCKGQNRDWYMPRKICANCPVKLSCLAQWLATTPASGDDGYVGDTTPAERELIRQHLDGRAAA